ncbi:thioesterase family protein [Nocardiopsis salina]|uniref:thioesterase family protein n=1 Tax=Nocardiopsis salina TaxID=245836 RepID=UPI000373BFAC|nr:hotdog domain-containing protein [Nocardiopsis salina]
MTDRPEAIPSGSTPTDPDTLAGASHTIEHVVAPSDTAANWGNALDVLATPVLLWLGEVACQQLMEKAVGPGEMSLGVAHNSAHLAPTVLGDHVKITATLERCSDRKFSFRVQAWDSRSCVLQGTHTRAVVQREEFTAALFASQ